MLRFAALAIAAAIVAGPAQAAVTKSEKGVRVWRGDATQTIAAPSLKNAAAPCAHQTTIIIDAGWPGRGLQTHRWTGEAWDERLPLTTTGYFADRMAAGY